VASLGAFPRLRQVAGLEAAGRSSFQRHPRSERKSSMEKRLSERGSAQGRFMAAAARNEAASDGQPAGIKVQLTFPVLAWT
jgi:hypothetical protein